MSRHAQRHHRIFAEQPLLRADGDAARRRGGGVFRASPADRRGARPDQRPGAGDHRGAGAFAARGRLAAVVSGLGRDERASRRRADPVGLQVRRFGRDDRFQGRDRHLPGPAAGGRAASARGRGHSAGLRHADARADRHGARRSLSVPGQGDQGIRGVAHGAAHAARLVHRLPVAPGGGGDRDQRPRRRDEDLRGRARSRRAGGLPAVDDRPVRGAAIEQRQRRRRVPGSRGRGAIHPRREPGCGTSTTSPRS